MKNFTSKFKKLLTVLILLASFADASVPVLAADITSGQVLQQVGGKYGADLQSVVGATVNSNQTYATITTPGQTSYLKWNSLNTAPGQTLDYAFLQGGSTSINSVVGPSMSQFAGALITSGAGAPTSHVIISNPNGILLENGAYFNCNAFTLTTQQINWEVYQKATNEWALKDGTFGYGKYGKGGIQIGGQGVDMSKAVVLRVGELNVISPSGIAMDGADIVASDVRLITADGVNYVAAPGSSATLSTPAKSATLKVDATNAKATSASTFLADGGKKHNLVSPVTEGKSILIKNSAIAIKDNPNGKIYFLTKGNNDLTASIAALHSALDGTVKMDVAGNADFQAVGNLNIVNSSVGGDFTAKTLDKSIELKSSNTTVNDSNITLHEYLDAYVKEHGKIQSLIDVVKLVIKGDITPTELAIITKSHMNDVVSGTKTTVVNTTDTKYSGKGNISISDSTVGGKTTVDGADVSIKNLTTQALSTISAASNGVMSSRNDQRSTTVANTDYTWKNTEFYRSPEVGVTTYEIIGSHPETYTYPSWSLSQGWHTHTGTRTVNDWGNVYHVITPEGAITYPTAGIFAGNTTTTAPIVVGGVPVSSQSAPSTGATTLTDVYVGNLQGGNLYIAPSANTLTAKADGNINANGVYAGNTELTSKNGYVNMGNSAQTPENVIIGNLNVKAGDYANISNTSTVFGYVLANAANNITINNLNNGYFSNLYPIGDVTANTTKDISVSNSNAVNMTLKGSANDYSGANKIDVTNTKVTNKLIALAKDITLDNSSADFLIAAKTATPNLLAKTDSTGLAAADGVTIKNGSSFGFARAYAKDIEVKDASEVRGGRLSATNDLKVNSGATLSGLSGNNQYAKAGNTITVDNANINDTSMTATNALSVSNNSKLKNATLNGGSVSISNSLARGYLNSTASNGALNLTNVQMLDGFAANATLNSTLGNITINGSTLGDTIANAPKGKLTVQNNGSTRSKLASLTSTSDRIDLLNSDVTGAADLTSTSNTGDHTGIHISNSKVLGDTKANAYWRVLVNNQSELRGTNNLTSTGCHVNVDHSYLGDATINAYNGVELKNSTFGATSATANNMNVLIDNSKFNSLLADAKTTLTIQNGSEVYGNTTATSGGLLTVSGSSLNGVNALTSNNDGITITGSTLGNTTAKAAGKLDVNSGSHITKLKAFAKDIDIDNSTIKSGALRANNDINVKNGSRISKALLKAGDDITIKNGSRVKKSTLIAGNDITIKNGSTLGKSIAFAGNDVNVKNGSSVSRSFVKADNNINVLDSDVNSSYLKAGENRRGREGRYSKNRRYDEGGNGNIYVDDSTIANSTLDAKNDIRITDSTVYNYHTPHRANLKAGNDIKIYGSDIYNTYAKAGDDITIGASGHEGPFFASNREGGYGESSRGSYVANSTLKAKDDINVQDGSKVTKSFIKAGNDVNVRYNSKVTKSFVKAGDDVNVEYGSKIKKSFVQAKDDINIKYGSTAKESILGAGNNINVKYGSEVNKSLLGAMNNINIKYGSTLDKSIAFAGNDIKVKDSDVNKSTLFAMDDIKIIDSTVSKSDAYAGHNIKVSSSYGNEGPMNSMMLKPKKKGDYNYGSQILDSTLNAGHNIKVSDSYVENSDLLANNDIHILGSDIYNTYLDAGRDINVSQSYNYGPQRYGINSDMPYPPFFQPKESVVSNSTLNAGRDINVAGSVIENSDATAGNNIKVTGSGFYGEGPRLMDSPFMPFMPSVIVDSKLVAGNDVTVSDSVLINTINSDKPSIKAGNDIKIENTLAVGNLVADSGRNFSATDLTVIPAVQKAPAPRKISSDDSEQPQIPSSGNLSISAGGDVTLAGLTVGNDLNITKANSVSISNSNSEPMNGVPTIEQLAEGMSPVTDYNWRRFSDSDYEGIISKFGQNYGAGTRISYIGGDANISGVNGNVGIVNTAIVGSLNESNINGDTHLVRSFVGGDYLPEISTIKGDTNVYQSYIKGKYNIRYPRPNTLIADDVNRLEYGNPLDTVFRQQFSPRSFAAAEDELKLMKRRTLSSMGAIKNKPGAISITKGFYAY